MVDHVHQEYLIRKMHLLQSAALDCVAYNAANYMLALTAAGQDDSIQKLVCMQDRSLAMRVTSSPTYLCVASHLESLGMYYVRFGSVCVMCSHQVPLCGRVGWMSACNQSFSPDYVIR